MDADIFKKASLWLIRIGLFVVPFIPLYISKVLFFPFITGKAFLFRIIAEVVFAAWVFLAVFWPEYRPRKNAISLAMGFFVLVVVLATIFAASPSRALWSNFERMEGLLAYLHLAAYFLVLFAVFTKRDWVWFANLFVLAGLGENFYALFQKLGYLASPQGGFRVDGTVGNPTYLAAYLTFVSFVSLFLWQNSRQFLLKLFYAAIALFSLLMIYFTATRGAVLGLLGAGVLASLSYLIFEKVGARPEAIFYKKLAALFLLLLILVPSVLWYSRSSDFVAKNPVLARLSSTSFTERTILSRFLIWRLAFEGVKERPLLGWGPENFNAVFAKHYNPGLYEQEPWFDRSHNIIFDWLITGGILGFLAYFSLIFAAGWTLWHLWRQGVFSLGGTLTFATLVVAYLFQNLFVFDQLVTYLSFFALLAFLAAMIPKETKNKRLFAAPARTYEPILAAFMLFAALTAAYFINLKPYLANKNLLSALQAHAQNDFQGAFERFERAISLSSLGRQEARENFTRFAVLVAQNANLPQDFRVKVFTRALAEAQASVSENSLDPRPHLFLATLYRIGNSSQEALAVLEKAKALIPAKQQIYFEITDIYVSVGDYAKAAQELETAFELLPEFTEARVNLAAIYILGGRQAQADKLLMEGFGVTEYPHNLLVQVYYRAKDYDRLSGIWRAFVHMEPQKLEYRRSLAGSYLLAGKRGEAIKTLAEAVKDFPNFKEEGEALIKELYTGG
ncbi:MAG: O-antigen ligase family protein [bacterium]|nr:O-antigen ligase family protein [bacterium]